MSHITLQHRIFTAVLLVVTGVYLLMVVAPFFVLGIHQQPVNLVIGGMFDPKGLAPYSYDSAEFGYYLYVASILVIIGTPIVAGMFAGALLLHVLCNWGTLQPVQRVWSLGTGLLGLGLGLFFFTSPLARLIMIWFLD